jgi:hypothetical protein
MQLSLGDDSEDDCPLDPCKELMEYLESKCEYWKCHGSARTPLGTHANGEDSRLEESRKAICT